LRTHSRTCNNSLVGINSEVPYQLDHAPTIGHINMQCKDLMDIVESGLGLLGRDGASS
jgi:hypothetical protein